MSVPACAQVQGNGIATLRRLHKELGMLQEVILPWESMTSSGRSWAMTASTSSKDSVKPPSTGTMSTSKVPIRCSCAGVKGCGSFLPFDFGSSFGTVSQGIHGFLPPLEGSDIAVPKVHILHA